MLKPYLRLPTLTLILSLVLAVFSAPVVADIAVIVNPGNSVDHLTSGEVKALFLKKRVRFPNGQIATPVNQSEDSRIYEQFAEKVLHKDPSQLKSFWSTKIFSGKGTPPEVLDGDAAIKARVSRSLEAVGYVDSSQVDNSVKVVYTLR
jgi:ABC-type phosphate transport system substrate-binding protein